MRFHIAFAFAILGAAVEALPVTGSNTDIAQPLNVKNTLPDIPLEKRQLAPGTGETTTVKDDYVVTTSKTQGTTNDKTGYSWEPAGLGNSLKRRQLGTTTTVKDDNYVTVSKSQGTTNDKIGYSWKPVGL